MKITEHNPTNHVYSTGERYVHSTLVDTDTRSRTLHVSGVVGLEPDGTPGQGIEAQLRLIWQTLKVILKTAGMTEENVVIVRSFLVDRSFGDINARYRMQALNDRPVAATTVVADLLDPEWLAEIEVVAMAETTAILANKVG